MPTAASVKTLGSNMGNQSKEKKFENLVVNKDIPQKKALSMAYLPKPGTHGKPGAVPNFVMGTGKSQWN